MQKLKRIHITMLIVILCSIALFTSGFFYGQEHYPEAEARRAAYGYLEDAKLLPDNIEVTPESGVVSQWAPSPSDHPGFIPYASPGVLWPDGVMVRLVSFDFGYDGYVEVYMHPKSLDLLHIETH